MHLAIGRLRSQGTRCDRVRVAAPVEQEILVFHVRKFFWVKGHSDKVEIGIEAMDLDGILDVVVGRTVAVVIGLPASGPGWAIHNGWCGGRSVVNGRYRIASENVRNRNDRCSPAVERSPASRAQIILLCH